MTTAADSRLDGRRDRGRPDASTEWQPYAIEIDGMSVWYGGTAAVHNLSLHVPHGSIYGLAGPSGAGKSTTLRALATLQQPDAGKIVVDGIDVRADPEAARSRIGYLPDFSGVYESLTVDEYLDFYGEIYKIPARRRRQVRVELLELVGLTAQRDRPTGSLSRSMRQQLALARCLIHDPQVLLLDEPAAGLDPRSRLELHDILRELQRFRKTILIGSNMLEEIAQLCTHLGIMQAGELVAEGPMEEFDNEDGSLEDVFLEVTEPRAGSMQPDAGPSEAGAVGGEFVEAGETRT